jgi:hypothetical protein
LTDKETISQQELPLASQSQMIKSLEGKVELLLELLQKKVVKKDTSLSWFLPFIFVGLCKPISGQDNFDAEHYFKLLVVK